MQASTGSTVNAASLDNAGIWLLSQQASAADSVTVGDLVNNTGTLQGAGNTTVTANRIDNRGKLLAGGNLTANVTTSMDNRAAATTQATQVLAINGSNAALTNASGGKLLGDGGLSFNVASLDNAGVIQGGTRTDTAIAARDLLTNRAGGVLTVAATAAGAGSVSATTISNPGTLQSAGALTLNVGTGGLTNDGTTVANNGNITVQSRGGGGNYTASVNGLMDSGSQLSPPAAAARRGTSVWPARSRARALAPRWAPSISRTAPRCGPTPR